ncbi:MULTISPECIES: hypothetical protein [Streptomyces]|uniref:Uncharacterized protein n=1 Tax=Streptomyces venezuelae (strain ATCC 10712 / CBS 650.69 / DSM 40230 / JCM 4526 / NBRC 13096 / PD 04745) TaxID=953739 RepID=F2R9F3_STRVP|nr:hypothetical protein [Streptomyces venezuelae]APE24536.1 hypothetical protein vnz_28240 [Streptomyces venezuelae]CCA58996.1 hypothetical protein SVEN_5710 [Streptomyces venezuelae ATCC 10712]
MTRSARLPVPSIRLRWSASDLAEIIPGLIVIGWNVAGIALAGTLVIDEIDSPRELAAATAPDLDPHAEEQPQHEATNATASTLTYHGKAPATHPVHQTAPPPLHSDDPHEELWS